MHWQNTARINSGNKLGGKFTYLEAHEFTLLTRDSHKFTLIWTGQFQILRLVLRLHLNISYSTRSLLCMRSRLGIHVSARFRSTIGYNVNLLGHASVGPCVGRRKAPDANGALWPGAQSKPP